MFSTQVKKRRFHFDLKHEPSNCVSKRTKICSSFCFAPSFAISIQKCQSSHRFSRHRKGIVFLRRATEILPGQRPPLSTTNPEQQPPTLSAASTPAHLCCCSQPLTPLPPLLLGRRHGQKPLAMKDPRRHCGTGNPCSQNTLPRL